MNNIPKPDSCKPCPFYNHGKYFTPDNINPSSKVLFVAQNPGEYEEKGLRVIKTHRNGSQVYHETEDVVPQPLIGPTGVMFNTRFLPRSGLKREDISVANAIRCRPGKSLGLEENELPSITTAMRLETSKADVVKALRHCRDTYLKVPETTELIVTMGRHAAFALTGINTDDAENKKRQKVIETWRGYGLDVDYNNWRTVDTSVYHPLVSKQKVFFTVHPAVLFRDAKLWNATLLDFSKIKRLIEKRWPRALPTWRSTPPEQWPKFAAFDTEYTVPDSKLIRWSLCDNEGNLYCVEASDTTTIPVQEDSMLLIQNALADIHHLAKIIDIQKVTVHDLMLAHAVLYTGENHGLNYIASKYGAFNRYKHLSEAEPQLYSAMDAFEPLYIWMNHFLPEFKKDTKSWDVYRKSLLPLVPIIDKAQTIGVDIDGKKLEEVTCILSERLNKLQARAEEITGIVGLNLNGNKDLGRLIYGSK